MPSVLNRLSPVMAALLVLGAGLAGGPVAAHDGIASSDPESGSVLDEPIDSVTIDFGAEIGSTTQIAVLAPDGTQLESTTTVISPATATSRVRAARRGGDLHRQLPRHLGGRRPCARGPISFTYGDPSTDTMSPVLFGAIAVVILAIGGWFSWRARQRGTRTGPCRHRRRSVTSPVRVIKLRRHAAVCPRTRDQRSTRILPMLAFDSMWRWASAMSASG